MTRRAELIGQRFGLLTVRADGGSDGRGQSLWECRCDCGGSTTTNANKLLSGHTRSCGCLTAARAKETMTKHGKSGTRTHRIWKNMVQRCENPHNHKFARYGGRGISIHREWRQNFERFLADMGECPDGLSIDRIDNNRGYEPGNCRWATPKQQARNMSRNRFVEWGGQARTIAEVAETAGVSPCSLRHYVEKGESPETAVALAASRRQEENNGNFA